MNAADDKAKDVPEEVNALSARVIGASIEVHRHLGPGLLESTYDECLAHELTLTASHSSANSPCQ